MVWQVTVLQQLLLIPLLAPLLAVLLLGSVNPRPPVALRLLVWTSPALPLGAWIAGAAATAAALSAAATTLALRQGQPAVTNGPDQGRRWRPVADTPTPGPPRHRAPASANGGPSRPPGEPAPTVEVPYRVIRRGETTTAPAAERSGTKAAATTSARAHEPAGPDGWDQPLSESWD